MEIIGVLLIGLLAVGLIGGAFYLLLWIIGASLGQSQTDATARQSGMNEGDFHSGPEGYSPNTAYPETFYGSGGRSDDLGGHDEGDFNR
jgi:hypothetical protein